jgi:hypothetical protein
MSQHYGDYEDFLRGALHAAVDSAEPAGDGLERIRTRLTTPHPLPVAWLLAVCSWVARRARGSLDSVSAWLQTVPGEVHRRDGAAEGRYTQRLRLVTTVAAVTVLLAISVSTLTPFGRHVISQAGSVLNSIGGGEPAGTGEQGLSGQSGGGAGAAGTTNGGQSHVQAAASCTPGASALAVPPAKTSPALPGEREPGPSPPAHGPASPPAGEHGPASPPARDGPGQPPRRAPRRPARPTDPQPVEPARAQPGPRPEPSAQPERDVSASAAGPSPSPSPSPAASPSPVPAGAPPDSTAPSGSPPDSTAPASTGPSSSPDSSSSSGVSPASSGNDGTGTGSTGPPAASPAPATDPGLSPTSAGPEDSTSG